MRRTRFLRPRFAGKIIPKAANELNEPGSNSILDQAIFLIRLDFSVERSACDTKVFCCSRFVTAKTV